MLSALLSVLLSAFAFAVWRIVGRGENPAGLGTSVSGGIRTRSVGVLKLYGRIQNDEIKGGKWDGSFQLEIQLS